MDASNLAFNKSTMSLEGGEGELEIDSIFAHRFNKKKLELKCWFKGISKATSWLDFRILMLENPELLYKYAARKTNLEKILKKYMHVYDPKSTTS